MKEDQESGKAGKPLAGVTTESLESRATDSLATPRPWRAATFAIYGANGEHAAHTGGCERTNEARIANAELIVHRVNLFPTMIVALQKIYDCGSISEAERVAASALALARGNAPERETETQPDR